jgi:bidirectional [NiFe] hydrogenase diaphorase subunit
MRARIDAAWFTAMCGTFVEPSTIGPRRPARHARTTPKPRRKGLIPTMPLDAKKVAPPSTDKRWRIVETTMRRHGNRPDALIEALHSVQEVFGYLDETAMRFCAQVLRVSLSKVYAVASFYHFFTLKPQGKHTCVVCMGTACYIKGAANLISAVTEHYGVKAGETSEDGQISLLTARCFGSCGLAPAATVDGEVLGKIGAGAMLEKIAERIQKGETANVAD